MVKGKYSKEGFTLTEDYIIPKQKISGSEVLYEELTKYQRAGYNCIIHSHHYMTIGFSVKDRNYINCQNTCSVLYNNNGFKMATLSFKAGSNVFLVETDKIETVIENNIEVIGIENITRQSDKIKDNNKIKTGGGDVPFNVDEPLFDIYTTDNGLDVEYCEDGEHAIVNGYRIKLLDLNMCNTCKCPYPEYCDKCLSSMGEPIKESV
jgi:hypothetical protein